MPGLACCISAHVEREFREAEEFEPLWHIVQFVPMPATVIFEGSSHVRSPVPGTLSSSAASSPTSA